METQDSPRRRGRETFLTLALTLVFGVGFVAVLNFLTFGILTHVVGVVVAIGIIGTFHYLVWGQTLSEEVAAERAAEELRQRRAACDEHVRTPDRPRRF
ncbi:MAG: hypothetical protein IT429_04185 [Gemmataceae bacterium]|nr:hypothetical protein [Gemmataceae bacterium]